MEKNTIEILEQAISDAGFFRWWANNDSTFLLEFGGVQLYANKPEEKAPQSSVIAIQFFNNLYLSFHCNTDVWVDWYVKLQKDEISPFAIEYEKFEFNNRKLWIDIDNTYENKKIILSTDDILTNKITFSFEAHGVAVLASSNEFNIKNHEGVISENDIIQKNTKWWEYWNDYWDKRDTIERYEKDYACEVCIPSDKFKFNK